MRLSAPRAVVGPTWVETISRRRSSVSVHTLRLVGRSHVGGDGWSAETAGRLGLSVGPPWRWAGPRRRLGGWRCRSVPRGWRRLVRGDGRGWHCQSVTPWVGRLVRGGGRELALSGRWSPWVEAAGPRRRPRACTVGRSHVGGDRWFEEWW